MGKSITKVWTFTSDSNSSKTYETLQYSDLSTSCNCMGWTRRVASDGSRSCKHTRYVDQGIADSHCVSSHEYEDNTPAAKTQAPPVKAKPSKLKAAPIRKIQWQ